MERSEMLSLTSCALSHVTNVNNETELYGDTEPAKLNMHIVDGSAFCRLFSKLVLIFEYITKLFTFQFCDNSF
jgi:hypothetical protein